MLYLSRNPTREFVIIPQRNSPASALNQAYAVIGYVPDTENAKIEVSKFLYPSWLYSTRLPKDSPLYESLNRKKLSEPRRIDLLLFMDPQAIKSNFMPGNCTVLSVRDPIVYSGVYTNEVAIGQEILDQIDSSTSQSQCIVIPHDRPQQNFWQEHNYLFMYSIDFLGEVRYLELIKSYALILKIDVDSFISPSFPYWTPESFLSFGKGSYVHEDFTSNRLKMIAKKLGLRHRGLHNIGPAWFGQGQAIYDTAVLTVAIAKHFLLSEFPPEIPLEWSRWWKGVTSMYASELALNHLFDSSELPSRTDTGFDEPSISSSSVWSIQQIHTWHIDGNFSKFVFKQGSYTKEQYPRSSLDVGKVKDYCMFIALYADDIIAEIEVY
jgi:hypothetical protein